MVTAVVVLVDDNSAAQVKREISERYYAAVVPNDLYATSPETALPQAEALIKTTPAPAAVYDMALESMLNLQEAEAAYEHLSKKYKALFRYTKSCEEELCQILYRWLPRSVDRFSPLAQLKKVEERGDMVDQYQLTVDIGKGNFGTVYNSKRPDGSVVAVKKMPKTKFLTLQSVSRLATELKLLCGVEEQHRHPNILYFESVMHSSSHLYISMPLLGKDVFELISEAAGSAGLHEATALQVVTPIISALDHLHQMGYAHRDVKSENILVTYTATRPDEEGPGSGGNYVRPPMNVVVHKVHLIDFDMCCRVTDAQRSEGCGSLGFMAPEAMVKDVPDCTKLDTWSIGCVLLEALFGHEWFSANWLDHYRNHRELRYSGPDREGVDFFKGILSRQANKAALHVTSCTRAILRNALVTDYAQRAPAHSLRALVNEYATDGVTRGQAMRGQGSAEECPESTMMDAQPLSSSSPSPPRRSRARSQPRVSPASAEVEHTAGQAAAMHGQRANGGKGTWSGEQAQVGLNGNSNSSSAQPHVPSLPPLGSREAAEAVTWGGSPAQPAPASPSAEAVFDIAAGAQGDRRPRMGNVLDNPKLLTQRNGVPLDRGSPPEGSYGVGPTGGMRLPSAQQNNANRASPPDIPNPSRPASRNDHRMKIESFSSVNLDSDNSSGPTPPLDDQQQRKPSPASSIGARSVRVGIAPAK